MLGLVPLALGIRRLWMRSPSDLHPEAGVEQHRHAGFLAVMGVTVANGGDNLSVYIALFASDLRMIPIYAAVFAVMTAVWCAAGYALVNNRVAGQHVRRYGHIVLPFVLMALGLYILAGARVLLR